MLKWLYPGMRLKRWGFLALIGLLLLMLGSAVSIESRKEGFPLPYRIADWVIRNARLGVSPGVLGAALIVLGGLLGVFALAGIIRSVAVVLDPELSAGELVDVIYRRRRLAQGKRIVVIGGGTGLSTMLRGLKRYTSNITAIVTVADDGGSSGKLKRQLNILPPGDIRNCLVALADDETQMTELFQFRFGSSVNPDAKPGAQTVDQSPPPSGSGFGEGLRDHAFGNLLIAAMCAINQGDFNKAVKETSRVLNIRGSVLPSTVEHVHLSAEMEDGSTMDGETNIAHSPLKIKRMSMVPENACPLPEVIAAINQAEMIVIGPGSVYTSIIPNLLVEGVPEALHRSKAKKVYICNVMTQPGESDGFSAFDHIRTIERHARKRIFDYALVNTARPKQQLLEKYRSVNSVLVEPDCDRIKAEGYRPVAGDFINQTNVVRHDENKLSKALMKLLG